MKNADFVTIDRNERLTFQSFATIILLFTYAIKYFLWQQGKRRVSFFVGFPQKDE